MLLVHNDVGVDVGAGEDASGEGVSGVDATVQSCGGEGGLVVHAWVGCELLH